MTSLSQEDPNEIERMANTNDPVILSEEDIETTGSTLNRYKPKKKVCRGYFPFSLLIVLQCLCIIVLAALLVQNIIFSDPPAPSKSLPPSQNQLNQRQPEALSDKITENPSRPTVMAIISDKNQIKSQPIPTLKTQQSNNSKPQAQSSVRQEVVSWPRTKQGQDENIDFNLWDLSPTLKASLLRRFKSLPPEKMPQKTDNFMEINLDKNQDFEEFAKKFEADIEVIDWHSMQLTSQESEKMGYDYDFALKERLQRLERIIGKYKAEYMGKSGFIEQSKQITYEQFLDNLEYQTLTGQNFRAKPELDKLYKRQRHYFETKYKVNQYSTELHACVIAPTYLNDVDFRYAWHLESIFHQDYSNFRLIIIDDASTDKTTEKIARHLKWRNFPAEKAILIRSKVHRTALENIYYAVHKYCDFNQIFYIIDGDDELAGTQAFRLYNALYQQQKLYVLYSNYLDYDSKNLTSPVRVGLSQSYLESAIQQNKYRTTKHAYSHLRTMMSDLFLLQRVESFKDGKGKFYWTIYDNAMYFPALEMSCARVKYVPQQLYWYTSNTGMNDWRTMKQREYSEVKLHIQNTQKHYQCINNVFKKMKSALEGGS